MKAIDHHLYDRGGRYYYRSALPRNFKPFLPFNEIKLSLGTSDLGQARLYVARLKLQSYLDVDWNDLPKGKKQSYITVNNRLTPLIALFSWAETNELYKGSNPFSGLIIKEAKQYATKRTPYKTEELQTLFTCPIYKGRKGQTTVKRLEAGEEIYKDYLYTINYSIPLPIAC